MKKFHIYVAHEIMRIQLLIYHNLVHLGSTLNRFLSFRFTLLQQSTNGINSVHTNSTQNRGLNESFYCVGRDQMCWDATLLRYKYHYHHVTFHFFQLMYVAGHLFELRKECDARGGQVCLREKNGKAICQFFVQQSTLWTKLLQRLFQFADFSLCSLILNFCHSNRKRDNSGRVGHRCSDLADDPWPLKQGTEWFIYTGNQLGLHRGTSCMDKSIYIHVFIYKEATTTRKNMEKLPWLGIASLGASEAGQPCFLLDAQVSLEVGRGVIETWMKCM